MESLTKPKISRSQLEAIARKHFDSKLDEAIELKDGWFNAAFLLKLQDGRESVLKIAPTGSAGLLRYEENLLQVEVEVMRLMEDRTDVPVPHILAYDRDKTEVESEYFLMERLPGVPYNTVRDTWSEDEQVPVQREVGQCLRAMHGIRNPLYGLYNRAVHETWREAFGSMFEMLESDGRDLGVDYPDRAFELGRRLFPALDSVQEACLVHWDLWDGNVFVDQKKLTGVIDFERALWGDPLIEANFIEVRPGTIEGYGRDPFTMPYAKQRRLLYDLYLFLVMVIESKFRGFTAEHEAWPRMKLDETLKQISLLS